MFEPHSKKQDDVIFSMADLTLAATGVQWGKTLSGGLWFKRGIFENPSEKDNFILVAPNYKIMRQSSLPVFLDLMRGCGRYNKADAEFKIAGGGTVYLRTGTEPDSIVGITNVKRIWGDEAGKFSKYFWENIQARAAFCNCPIMLTTSPYTLNWMYKEIILPFMRGDRDKEITDGLLHIVQASSIENPYFSKESYAKQKRTMDPMRFNMLYGGQWGRMEGLVYKCFDEDENQIEESRLVIPRGTRFFGSIDWGFTHPAHIGIRAITPDKMHYKLGEYHKSGLQMAQIIQHCHSMMALFPIETFFCGPDQPGRISELNSAGVPAQAANNDVRLGIDRHYELIASRKFKIVKGKCPHTVDELDTYHYAEPKDLKPDQDSHERLPVKVNDDAVDADRYCTIETYDLTKLQIKAPKKPKIDPLFLRDGSDKTERFS